MKNTKKLTPTLFQRLLLNWFDQHGRKNLPWQQNKTPYRVWVSEIMLQQTQVATAIPYFERFVSQFPDVQSLARTTEDDVLHIWSGLGYYTRARNLHRTANIVTHDFNGNFPADIELLQALPGIGRSTAGAILALAFQQKAPILDGNVRRVLTRLHGITQWPGEKEVVEQLWTIAEKFTPSNRIADYTQAIMDLGATHCVRGAPQCHTCPFQSHCIAHLKGIAHILPQKKTAVKLPVRQVTMLVLVKNNKYVLLQKRPPTGVWASLWSLPEITPTSAAKDIPQLCQQQFDCTSDHIHIGDSFRHTFSHFHLDITPAFVSVKKSGRKIMEAGQQIWYNLQQPETIGLPAPIKVLLAEIQHDTHG